MNLKAITATLISVVISAVIGFLVLIYIYSTRYVQDSPDTATTGLIMTNTLNLEHYKNIASGTSLLGSYDRYSRSLNHSDVITVYCKDFCKNK